MAGATVAIVMPMTATAVIAYLGTVLAGCAVVGIADSFSSREIASRLRISRAEAIVTQACLFTLSKLLFPFFTTNSTT